MLLRKTTWFWKSGLAAISFVLILSISGCSDAPPEENTVSETVIDVQAIQEESEEDADEIISVCIALYEKAEEENKLADLETIRSIVNRLGENGYSAVDSRNQINMTEPEKVVEFCEKVDAQEEAEITILEISYLGGFVKYDLHTKGGNVDVVRSYYKYENGNMKREVIGNYQAEYWNYTEEGYLMFSGVWFSEELYVLTLSGAEEHTALRVQPLDETYRELSRKYLNPISFERNNMFIVDWSEEDFGDLNFYDMYDILYPKVNGQYAPYVADDNLSVSAVYQIPKEEFESVIMKYFNIDSETLQSKTIYDLENLTYEYKPRGFEEVEYPEYPYSEVVGFTENNDGTITLTANVVFPYAGDSKVYAHEVVVRPLENGRVQYVSNRIIPSEDNYRETWHTPRLTLEEWEESRRRIMEDVKWLLRKCGLLILLLLIFVIVGVICWGKMHEEEQKVAEEIWEPPVEIENSEAETEEAENAETSTESAYWFIPQASDCLISDEEKEQLQSMVLSAADSVAEIYKDIVIADAPSYSSGISEFTNEQRKTVVKTMGRSGLVSVEEDTAMQNHEAVETFYADYLDGRDSMVTVFEVHRDGLIGAVTFIYRKGELQT